MSQAASGYARQNLERYYTPHWVTHALLGKILFSGLVLDPAAGDGKILDVLTNCGIQNTGSDIEPETDRARKMDFMGVPIVTLKVQNIITNPPYGKAGKLAVQFIERALEATEDARGKVAMLLRVDFDSANGRRHIFGNHEAFDAKCILTQRIRWTNLPQSAAGPTENHAWFVWDWARDKEQPIRLGYLP